MRSPSLNLDSRWTSFRTDAHSLTRLSTPNVRTCHNFSVSLQDSQQKHLLSNVEAECNEKARVQDLETSCCSTDFSTVLLSVASIISSSLRFRARSNLVELSAS